MSRAVPRAPTLERLGEIAAAERLDIAPDALGEFAALIAATLPSYHTLDAEPPDPLPGPIGNRAHRAPTPDENPFGAWARLCEVTGTAGPLSGKRVALKDNIALAGVPMMNGTAMLSGFVPQEDATVAHRILAAGGTITGKAVCEHLCFSGGSHTADSGPVRNPHDPARNAGGSSSGSAALLAAGACDMAVGGDQGGSIRVPASYCGVVGLKPTFGLVPYTGAAPIERTLDHLGPMARTVADAAALLAVLMGPDGIDPRQASAADPGDVTTRADDLSGIKIALLDEGFGWPQSEPPVDHSVRAAVNALSKAGAAVGTVSIPLHTKGSDIWTGIAVEGALATVVDGNSGGTNAAGHFDPGLIDAFSRAKLRSPADFSPTVKLTILLGRHLQATYGGRYYGLARNLSRRLAAAYDTALAHAQVLAMPTTPRQATVLPAPEAPLAEIVARAWECEVNTRPFDVTGHPALSVLCGTHDGLPVGLMLIARKGGEATLLDVAAHIETLSTGV